jgi:Uncharacterized alpha/beta hydrolase domain (DUF2235)
VSALLTVYMQAVWDTVGSLGIPNLSWIAKLGFPHSTKEFRFFDTDLSNRIEHAFQALALDEHRLPFSPTIWERTAANQGATELRQVWFPGNHGNIGGGWADAGIANITLACKLSPPMSHVTKGSKLTSTPPGMMDQLASVGVEFDEATISRIFTRLERYYRDMQEKDGNNIPHKPVASGDMTPSSITSSEAPDTDDSPLCGCLSMLTPKAKHWAVEPIYERNVPIRPWGLGALRSAKGVMYKLAGDITRTPGLYRKLDPMTGDPTNAFLEDTNERMHSSVRTRLAVQGLGLNDEHVWEARALKGKWRLRQTAEDFVDPIANTVTTWEPMTLMGMANIASGEAAAANNASSTAPNAQTLIALAVDQQRPLSAPQDKGKRWVWEYCGPEKDAPPGRLIVEEPLGPYERQLLRLSGGTPNVYEFAEGMDVKGF